MPPSKWTCPCCRRLYYGDNAKGVFNACLFCLKAHCDAIDCRVVGRKKFTAKDKNVFKRN